MKLSIDASFERFMDTELSINAEKRWFMDNWEIADKNENHRHIVI